MITRAVQRWPWTIAWVLVIAYLVWVAEQLT